jgi:hypothetical protein
MYPAILNDVKFQLPAILNDVKFQLPDFELTSLRSAV